LAECGAIFDPDLRADGDFSEQSGYEAMHTIYPHNPDAVFVASDTMAVGALRALRELGVGVPEDLAIVSFDGLPSSEKSTPPLSTVRQPISATGGIAVKMLLELLSGEVSGPVSRIVPTELVIRESSGTARHPADAEAG
jgi:LacI family transcriptional regulator